MYNKKLIICVLIVILILSGLYINNNLYKLTTTYGLWDTNWDFEVIFVLFISWVIVPFQWNLVH